MSAGMAMRTFAALLTVLPVLLAGPTGRAAQDAGQPAQTFRSGIDLITIDVTALDRQGRPVEDLQPRDFTVTVDGQTRPVVSAALVRFDRQTAEAPAPPGTVPLVTSNLTAGAGRRIVIAVDQMGITPGAITPLLHAASRFVDRLTAGDHVAFVTMPDPGPRVDFTTDHDRVRRALQGLIGQPPKFTERSFDMSLSEALALDLEMVSYDADRLSSPADGPTGPMLDRVMARGCRGVPIEELTLEELARCRRDVINESRIVVQNARVEATISLRQLEAILRELLPLEGSTSLVLISARLLNENPLDLDEIIRLAAAAHTSIDVIAVDPASDEWRVRSIAGSTPPGALMDRSLELDGLRSIAAATGGSLFRAVGGSGDGIFERLSTELSASYVVAVAREPSDPDRQQIAVEVRRRGVTVRTNPTFVATAAIDARRPIEDVLRDALSSPFAIPGLPLRVSTFSRRDAASGAYRLHVAAEIGPPGTRSGELAIGYALMDEQGRPIASAGTRRPVPGGDGNAAPLRYDTTLAIEPGTYLLRVAAVDAEGRRGSVVHRVVFETQTGDELATSDLIVGSPPEAGEPLAPSVEPRIDGGRLAAYLELYRSGPEVDKLAVRLEIAEGEATPALVTRLLNVGPAPQPDWRVATGALDITLLPGRYIARAAVQHGDATVRVLSRPFVLERAADAPDVAALAGGAPIPPELGRRTAAYAAGFVTGFSNIVAQEEFSLTRPARRVTSDFLLVQYPGSERDLLTYRDVTHLDGTPRADRQERLTTLFLQPVTGLLRQRAREIALDAEAYVPSMLNPLFVLAFLQAGYQSRFELTIQDAGPQWPSQVKAVTFVETARPTLLRAGPLGDQDVPARGTAWIEEATGRILETELQLGSGRSVTTITTRFRLDERLQIMVPEVMRTQNPAGIATYSGFRRFNVQTDIDLDARSD
jgi:VWFA-related protein